MDYFGQLVDDLVDMAEDIERLYPHDGAKVIKGLERVMKLAAEAETVRYERGRRAAAAALEAKAQMPGPPAPVAHAAEPLAAGPRVVRAA